MAMPDKRFPIWWTIYLIVVVVGFVVLEGLALFLNDTTLSRYTWEINQSWPLFYPMLAMIFGVVICHFCWHWMPPGSDSKGCLYLAVLVGATLLLLSGGESRATDLALKKYLPDPDKTPGESNPVLTQKKICGPGFRTGPFGSCRPLSSAKSIALTACRITRERATARGVARSIISGLSRLGERIRLRISGRSPTADPGARSRRTPSRIVCTSWYARATSP